MQNQPGFHNMMPHMNHGNALRPDLGPSMNPRNYHVPPASYVSSYPAVPGLQHPMAYHAGMISPRPMSSPPGSVSPAGGNSNSGTPSGPSKNSGGQVEGLLSVLYVLGYKWIHSLMYISIFTTALSLQQERLLGDILLIT